MSVTATGAGPWVLVTDVQDRPGLAALRCLSASGYRVTAVGIARLAPGLWSRRCEGRAVVPDAHDGIDEYVAALERLLREQRHELLLAGTDETVYAVSSRRARLSPHVELGLPAEDAVTRAFDKTFLAAEAERVGIGPPEGRVCDSFDDALAAAHQFGFPVLVKGARTLVELENRIVRYPSRYVTDEDGLAAAVAHMGRCIVQRQCTGSVLSFAGVATAHGLLATVLARYVRTWPPGAGYAAFSETIPLPDELREQVAELIGAIGWRGIFELELIDGADGVVRAIDFNPRPYGSMSLARKAGAPLASLWAAWLRGLDPQPVTARPGFRYRWEQGDARRILWELRNGRPGTALAAIRPRLGTVHPYFDPRDPAPFLANCAELVRVRWRHARGLD